MPQRSIRFPDDLAERAEAEAARLDRSFSWLVVRALEAALGAPGNEAGNGSPRSVAPSPGPAPPRTPAAPTRESLAMDRQRKLNAAKGGQG